MGEDQPAANERTKIGAARKPLGQGRFDDFAPHQPGTVERGGERLQRRGGGQLALPYAVAVNDPSTPVAGLEQPDSGRADDQHIQVQAALQERAADGEVFIGQVLRQEFQEGHLPGFVGIRAFQAFAAGDGLPPLFGQFQKKPAAIRPAARFERALQSPGPFPPPQTREPGPG